MLKIECPGCSEWVSLPFDIEIRETTCPKCARTIPVKDVYVSAGPYTIHRDVLIKNMHRYKKLLSEAEREFEAVEGADRARKDGDITAKSVTMFINHLKEMLSGCRGSTRHTFDKEVEARITINDRTFQARVINMSVSGLCLDASASPALDLTDEMDMVLSCGGKELAVSGRVAWSNKQNVLGVKFTNLTAGAREAIEACITEKSLILKTRK